LIDFFQSRFAAKKAKQFDYFRRRSLPCEKELPGPDGFGFACMLYGFWNH